MDAFDVLIQQTDEKVTQLKNFLADGGAESFEEYKRLCGEARGLLIAKELTITLKDKMENSDD